MTSKLNKRWTKSAAFAIASGLLAVGWSARADETTMVTRGPPDTTSGLYNAFEIGVAFGYLQGVGDVGDGIHSLTDSGGPGISGEVDLGWRINPNWLVGVYGTTGWLPTGDASGDAHNNWTTSAGVQAAYHFMPGNNFDPWVLACTNRDLAVEVKAHRFREDLYYRLAVVELVVPPLGEHREDIPALAAEFARLYSHRFGMDSVRLSPALIEALRGGNWPGNVRQLENTVARMVALHGGSGEIGVEAFPGAPSRSAESGAEPSLDGTLGPREQVDALERSIITRTLAAVSGNQSEAARRLGLSRSSLIDRLKKYGLAGGGLDSPP